MNLRKLCMALAIVASLFLSPTAQALKYTSDPINVELNDWSDLGVGPLTVSVNAGAVYVVASDTEPAPIVVGSIVSDRKPTSFQTNKRLWARAINSGAVVVTLFIDTIPVSPSAMTLTCNQVILPAGVTTNIVTANASRKFLRWQVTGVNPVTVRPGTGTVTAGQGMNYDPSSLSLINQGGGAVWDGLSVPNNAFVAVSQAGSSLNVCEGN